MNLILTIYYYFIVSNRIMIQNNSYNNYKAVNIYQIIMVRATNLLTVS